MNALQLLGKILPLLNSIRSDEDKLAKLLEFMEQELLSEEEDDNDDEQDDYKEKLPEKYREVVRQIADSLSAHLVCFFNPDTLEMEDVPKDMVNELMFEEYDTEPDANNECGLTFMRWEQCVEITPPESHESFEIMENFVNQLESGREANRLAQALSGRKPFANFNHLIHNSEYRDDWFAFRNRQLEKYVIQNYFREYLENDNNN
jgi:hypothetical protein